MPKPFLHCGCFSLELLFCFLLLSSTLVGILPLFILFPFYFIDGIFSILLLSHRRCVFLFPIIIFPRDRGLFVMV